MQQFDEFGSGGGEGVEGGEKLTNIAKKSFSSVANFEQKNCF